MPKTKVDNELIARYIESNPLECYVDYNDELSDDLVDMLLKGKKQDVIWKIEDMYYDSTGDLEWYWQELIEEVGCTREQLDEWLSTDGFYPSHEMSDGNFSRLLNNTTSYITATLWDADYNFYNWAYGYPLTYSDVKETLRLLNINPREFKELVCGGSTSGVGKIKGWFPDLPERQPCVDVKELWQNMLTLYDGVMNFLLGDLANVSEVLADNPEQITFKAGTNIVMYNFTSGAGITETKLIRDLTLPRKIIDFRNDKPNTYGIQSCYGFTNNYWREGEISNGDSKQPDIK